DNTLALNHFAAQNLFFLGGLDAIHGFSSLAGLGLGFLAEALTKSKNVVFRLRRIPPPFVMAGGLGAISKPCWGRPQRESIRAGLPCLTCSMARLSAGLRSSPFSIGPSAYQPIERASPAKSGSGPKRSMPICARLGSVPRVRASTS